MAEPNLLIGILGVIFGAGGLAVGMYSYRKQKEFEEKQRRFEEQLERKEELRALAEALGELRDDLDFWCSLIEEPRDFEDVDNGLYNLERDILSYRHSTKEAPRVYISDITAGDFTEGEQLYSTKDVMHYLQNTNESVLLRVQVGDKQPENLLLSSYYVFWDIISMAGFPFRRIQFIREEYEELLQQFDKNLMNDVETTAGNLLRNLLDRVFETKEGKVIDPSDYENTHEMGDHLYRYFLFYDGVLEDAEVLREEINRINRLRNDLLQTSYS